MKVILNCFNSIFLFTNCAVFFEPQEEQLGEEKLDLEKKKMEDELIISDYQTYFRTLEKQFNFQPIKEDYIPQLIKNGEIIDKTQYYPEDIAYLFFFKLLILTDQKYSLLCENFARVLFDLTIQPIKFYGVLVRSCSYKLDLQEIKQSIDTQKKKKTETNGYNVKKLLQKEETEEEIRTKIQKRLEGYELLVVLSFLFTADAAAQQNEPIVTKLKKVLKTILDESKEKEDLKLDLQYIIHELFLEIIKQNELKTNNIESLARPNIILNENDRSEECKYLISLRDKGFDQLNEEEYLEIQHVAERLAYVQDATTNGVYRSEKRRRMRGLNKFFSERTWEKIKNDPIYLRICIPHNLARQLDVEQYFHLLREDQIPIIKEFFGITDYSNVALLMIVSIPLFFFFSFSDDRILQEKKDIEDDNLMNHRISRK